MILTTEGQLLVCGSNIFNLLASNAKIQNNEVYQKVFKSIKFFEENEKKIKEIAVAEFHSLALNEKIALLPPINAGAFAMIISLIAVPIVSMFTKAPDDKTVNNAFSSLVKIR